MSGGSMGYLYSDFLHDQSQYALAERYWADLFEHIVQSEGVKSEWQHPWLNNRFSDGTPFGDGNPIFSARCRSRGLGVRIIQTEPNSVPQGADFDSWLDTFDGEGDAIRERVIS